MSVLSEHFSPHLQELRKRILISFIAIIVCSVAAYFFSEQLAVFFMKPLFTAHPSLSKLVYTNLTEAFISYLKISFLVGMIASFPVLCYQCWMFVAPGLRKDERKVAFRVVFWATALFFAGVSFAYFVVMPHALEFLVGFAGDQLEPMLKLDAYLTFVVRASLAFGLAFEVPFLMVVATKTGLVAKGYFVKQRKYFYLGIVVLSFLLTVGDIFSAVLLALPLFGLYEAGLLVTRLFSSSES